MIVDWRISAKSSPQPRSAHAPERQRRRAARSHVQHMPAIQHKRRVGPEEAGAGPGSAGDAAVGAEGLQLQGCWACLQVMLNLGALSSLFCCWACGWLLVWFPWLRRCGLHRLQGSFAHLGVTSLGFCCAFGRCASNRHQYPAIWLPKWWLGQPSQASKRRVHECLFGGHFESKT